MSDSNASGMILQRITTKKLVDGLPVRLVGRHEVLTMSSLSNRMARSFFFGTSREFVLFVVCLGVVVRELVELSMQFFEIDNTLSCLFSGRIDERICSEIEHDLVQHVSDFKKDREDVHLKFDLTEVIFISSPFLRLCLICFKVFGKDHFSIANVSADIYQVFHISGFAEMMHVTRIKDIVQKGGDICIENR